MSRYFAAFTTDKPQMREVRERMRPSHRAYLRGAPSQGVFVRLGGRTLGPHCDAMNGTLLIG